MKYIVTREAYTLEGWTPETLVEALKKPLSTYDIAVELAENQYGGGGLVIYETDELKYSPDFLRNIVKKVVDDVITTGRSSS